MSIANEQTKYELVAKYKKLEAIKQNILDLETEAKRTASEIKAIEGYTETTIKAEKDFVTKMETLNTGV